MGDINENLETFEAVFISDLVPIIGKYNKYGVYHDSDGKEHFNTDKYFENVHKLLRYIKVIQQYNGDSYFKNYFKQIDSKFMQSIDFINKIGNRVLKEIQKKNSEISYGEIQGALGNCEISACSPVLTHLYDNKYYHNGYKAGIQIEEGDCYYVWSDNTKTELRHLSISEEDVEIIDVQELNKDTIEEIVNNLVTLIVDSISSYFEAE